MPAARPRPRHCLSVSGWFYSSRTDLIRTATRNQLQQHAEDVRQTMTRRSFGIGVFHYDREALETQRRSGEQLALKVIGVLALGQDVTPELARETIRSIEVRGTFRASPAVKKALA
ncbi:MAG TPA: hypothetical protein VD789_10095, partial [Thermomicrobiales bacterium]|nr:hypothetical protein [Thermomicrobiales bacterium]